MLADQLGASGVITSVMGQSSTWFLRQHAPEVLALAVEHKMPTIVSAALRAFDDPAVKQRRCDDLLEPSAARFKLNDIPLRLLKRLDFAVLVRLLRRESILLADYHCHENYSTLADCILQTADFFTNAEQALVDDDKRAAQALEDRAAAPKNEVSPPSRSPLAGGSALTPVALLADSRHSPRRAPVTRSTAASTLRSSPASARSVRLLLCVLPSSGRPADPGRRSRPVMGPPSDTH